MRASSASDAALGLTWLCPGADALFALARSGSACCWPMVRDDPGAVLLLVRKARVFATPPRGLTSVDLRDPHLFEAALAGLREGASQPFVPWTDPEVASVARSAHQLARWAERLALATGRCPGDQAWVAGLLAPLGWLAVATAEPRAIQACLLDPEHSRRPNEIETRHWGLDAAALARRLARRWQLPPWLTAITGHLGLPSDLAPRFGAERGLFLVVQLAAGLLASHSGGLTLAIGTPPLEAAAALGLSASALEALIHEEQNQPQEPLRPSRPPHVLPLLEDLLRLAGENVQLREATSPQALEVELDALYEALREARAGEAERLRVQKLASLAEFAAGAGHEINNPLAVISGQAQFLLTKIRGPRSRLLLDSPEEEALIHTGETNGGRPLTMGNLLGTEVESALRKIIDQTQRVHQLLRELMQFARPPEPVLRTFDLGECLREVTASLAELAAQRQVRLQGPAANEVVLVHGDRGQIRTAVGSLVRNAVEAAPPGGWAAVRLDLSSAAHVDIVVEDDGVGPPPQQREHLFDPFYSGRTAGRGRGLGLPVAWRLAQQHGGDVRLASPVSGPTRFILSLPRPASRNGEHS